MMASRNQGLGSADDPLLWLELLLTQVGPILHSLAASFQASILFQGLAAAVLTKSWRSSKASTSV
jgi:hypothetical protein